MNKDDLLKAIDEGLDMIGLLGNGTPVAIRAIAAIVAALRAGIANTITPQNVLSRLAAVRTAIADNDADALDALHERFK